MVKVLCLIIGKVRTCPQEMKTCIQSTLHDLEKVNGIETTTIFCTWNDLHLNKSELEDELRPLIHHFIYFDPLPLDSIAKGSSPYYPIFFHQLILLASELFSEKYKDIMHYDYVIRIRNDVECQLRDYSEYFQKDQITLLPTFWGCAGSNDHFEIMPFEAYKKFSLITRNDLNQMAVIAKDNEDLHTQLMSQLHSCVVTIDAKDVLKYIVTGKIGRIVYKSDH